MRDEIMGIGAAARACGLTPRALRWWESQGLLWPRRDPANGRRRYGRAELSRLQHVLALKSLGLPLSEISRLLQGASSDPGAALSAQYNALLAEKRRVEAALQAVEAALNAHRAGRALDAPALAALIRMTVMTDWNSKPARDFVASHYTEEQMARFAEREWSEADQKQAEAEWATLIARAEELAGSVSPESAAAHALADDWIAQIRKFSLGDADIEQRAGSMWSDFSRWPEGVEPPFSEAVRDFIGEAMAARSACR